MIDPKEFLEILQKNGIEFFTGVPDSVLKHFCSCLLDTVPVDKHIINANEGLAVGLAAGYHLATGKVPCVYMQNAGLGNAINPLLSLADPTVYGIPMLLLVGWRGEPGLSDEPQHIKQGRIQQNILDTLEIPYEIISASENNIQYQINIIVENIRRHLQPCVLLVRRNTFKDYKNIVKHSNKYTNTRRKVIELILNKIGDDAIVVTTTGKISREVYECRVRMGMSHKSDFLNVGAMGHCSQIALGIALQYPDKKVYVIDGDGSVLMHMGTLAIIGTQKPKNLTHIMLNNGSHESVGAQPTVGFYVSINDIASKCGYNYSTVCEEIGSVDEAILFSISKDGPAFIDIRLNVTKKGSLSRPTILFDDLKYDFMKYLSRENLKSV